MPVRALNEWRAWTAELLSKTVDDRTLSPSSALTVHNAVKEVMNLIGPLAKPSNLQGLEDSLSEIFLDAVRLSACLRRQRAIWTMHFSCREVQEFLRPLMFEIAMQDELDRDYIRHAEARGEQPVGFALKPALLKRGNAEGEHLEKVHVAVRGRVKIYKSRRRHKGSK